MTNNKTTSISILGQAYTISCAPEHEQILHQAAKLLNQQLDNLRHSDRLHNPERTAIIAALNISAELVEAREFAKLTQITCQQLNQCIGKVLDSS